MPKPLKIHYSPAVITRADTPIDECVRLMQKHNVGSVLIVSDAGNQALVGIFTERDLLHKFDRIQTESLWKKPIRTIMSRPVKVLFASEIDKAPELMLKYGVRHLPIVVSDGEIKFRLVGIVSMRDLFRDMVMQRNEVEPVATKKKAGAKAPKLGVVTLDPYLVRFLEEGLGDRAAGLFQASFDELRRATIKANAFVLDLDHLNPSDWLEVLKNFNRDSRGPFTAIVFNPALYDAKTIQILKRLKDSRNFCTFTKPLPVPLIFSKLIPFL